MTLNEDDVACYKTAAATSYVPLSDESLAQVIADKVFQGAKLFVVANGFTARVANQASGGNWVEVGRGDLGLKAGEAAKEAKAGILEWVDVTTVPSAIDYY